MTGTNPQYGLVLPGAAVVPVSPVHRPRLLSLTADLLDLCVASPISARAVESVHYRLQQRT